MKKKALVLAICMACASPMVSHAKSIPSDISGLNLGDIQTRSYLGEPLKSIIPILFTSNKQASKLKVRLAPSSVYNQLGVEKGPELNNLHFKVVNKAKKPTIVISSEDSIHAPFLNFILEIESSKGSVYQDFTIMLDPRNLNTSKQNLNNKKASNVITATKYKIQPGDSLSKISLKFKQNRASLNRMMEAIHLKNPMAFIDNDINKIKSGEILNLPTLKEIQDTSSIVREASLIDKNSKQQTFVKNVADSVANKAISSQSTYTVKSGDTLSKITRNLGQKEISFTKMMKAIHSANPHAFSKNRINILKLNAVLTIPSFDSTASINSNNNSNFEELKVNKESVTLADEGVEDSQSIKDIANIKTAVVKQLKSANNEIVENLEKRLRELRSELTSASAESSDLKIELVAKKVLISKQNKKVNKLNNALVNLETKYQGYFEENTVDVINSSQVSKNGNSSELGAYRAKPLDSEDTIRIKEAKATQSIEQIVSTFLESNTSESNNLLSIKNLSYASLALILGFLLLQKRRALQSYTPISVDNPLKGSSKDIIPLKTPEESILLDDTFLTEIKKQKVTDQNKPVFTERKIYECELLVDELIEDLKDHQAGVDDKTFLGIACEKEIESILEDKEIDFDNFIQEDILETIQTNKPSSTSKDNISSDTLTYPEATINSYSSDTVLFQNKMDKLVQLVGNNDDVIKQETDTIDRRKEAAVD